MTVSAPSINRLLVILVSGCALVTGCALISGCKPEQAESETPKPPPPLVESIEGTSVIRGKIHFSGQPPKMPQIANVPCHEEAKPMLEETVIVNPNGTLRNTFVYLEAPFRVDGSKREPALMDQINCRYVPHALGVQINQPVIIRSSDPTFHNVHYTPKKNKKDNFSLTEVGDEQTVTFTTAEFVRMRCDIHPWMNAYIGVFDTPFFDVTEEDGEYELRGIPAGQYRLVAWHELYGPISQEITIADGAEVSRDFTYQKQAQP